MLLQKEILWRMRQKIKKLLRSNDRGEKPEAVLSEAELDGLNQEKNVINIFSTFRKEVTTKVT